jgi:hypothetical protein
MGTARSHFLLETALVSERFADDLTPAGCHYDIKAGAWVVDGTEALLVETPGYRGPSTKKGDIETGEDQKSD